MTTTTVATTTTTEPLADTRDMFAVHALFRREFGLSPGLVRAVAADDVPRTTLVAHHIGLVGDLLKDHHAVEDKHLWPRLRVRGTQEVALIAFVMEEQHKAVHHGLLRTIDALACWRESASARHRDALAETIAQLLPLMKEHLAAEEERAVPFIQKYITAAEYSAVGRDAMAAIPPEDFPVLFGMLMYETAPAVIDAIVSQMPVEVQGSIRDLAAKAYAAHARDVYGTATPPRATE
jgi:hypothetical protein